MIKYIKFLSLISILLIILVQAACKSNISKKDPHYGEATKELLELLENNPEIESMLISSIEKARQINPEKSTNPVQSLKEYIDFISYSETAMPWALIHRHSYADIYGNIFQNLGYFYFIIDQPLAELEGKGYFHNSLQYADPFASWVKSFSRSWGKYLDTEDSWNNEYYQLAFNDEKFGLQNDWYEDPSNWKTYNQFFARFLRSPDKRPIADIDVDSVVISPADSEPQGVWLIDSNSIISGKEEVPIKSASLYSISKLIGEDSEYENEFVNGTFTHSFLNVNDYHRYHFPLSGIIREVRVIQGINPTGGSISWDAANNRYAFDPSEVGWQSVETRGCVILETERYGLVALLPIGMVTVNSVNFEENIKPGTQVRKGDMLGYFLFGGSDFIIIFQQGVKFTLDVPKLKGGNYYHLLMGERLGFLSN